MKRKVFEAVIRHRRLVIVLFAVAAAVSAACYPLVGVDYEMADYLPADAPSTVAMDVMGGQFEGAIPNARVMAEDVSISEALELKEHIGAVEGVDEVTWLDDAVDVARPLQMQDAAEVEAYYKDGSALYTVAVDESSYLTAVPAIREAAGEGAALTGTAVSTELATASTVSQIAVIGIVAVAFCIVLLLLTTTSWLAPAVVLLGLGVAIVINAGTNIVFGTISFVTNAAGNVLQLAISLDFSVFLMTRYHECRGMCGSAEGDMVEALCKASTAILSSGCTVMFGFLALCVMQFQIGPDMGFALAKGIAISIITVFTLVPALFVALDKPLARFEHRYLVPDLAGLGKVVLKVSVPLAVAYLCCTVPAFLASTSGGIDYYYGASHIFGPETDYGRDSQAIEDVFGKRDTYVLMVPAGDLPREAALGDDVKALPQVSSIVSYAETVGVAVPQGMAEPSQLAKLQSEEYSRIVVMADVDFEGADAFSLVGDIRDIAQEHYPGTWLLAGEGVSTTDLMQTIVADKDVVDILAVAAVFAVLLLATRSVSLPVILALVIETAIWINFAVPYFTGAPEFFLAYLICSAVQLGVTVDYAILFADRYKELRRTCDKREAVVETVRSCTVAVLTSGLMCVVVGFAMSAVSTHGVLAQLGHFLGVGTAISILAVVFVLPGLLYAFDGVIGKTTLHAGFAPNSVRARR